MIDVPWPFLGSRWSCSWQCWEPRQWPPSVRGRPVCLSSADGHQRATDAMSQRQSHQPATTSLHTQSAWRGIAMRQKLSQINQVTPRRAKLVLGCGTVYRQVNDLSTEPASYINSAFYPPLDGKMCISFWAE